MTRSEKIAATMKGRTVSQDVRDKISATLSAKATSDQMRAVAAARPPSDVWTERRLERLPVLWADHSKSAAEIGRDLGGLTKNQVIGKVHRMNLPGRPSILPGKPIRPLDAFEMGTLCDLWPTLTLRQMARRLGRSEKFIQAQGESVGLTIADAAEAKEVQKPAPPREVMPARPVSAWRGETCQWPTTVGTRIKMLCDAPCEHGAYCCSHAADAYVRGSALREVA